MTLPFIILTKTFNYGSIKLKPWLKDEYKCSLTFMMHMLPDMLPLVYVGV